MIKEIKHNILINEFKKKIIEESYYNYDYYHKLLCHHKKTGSRLFSIHNNYQFYIYIEKIVELIPTELEQKEIIDFINSNFNKNNYPIELFDKYFKKINI